MNFATVKNFITIDLQLNQIDVFEVAILDLSNIVCVPNKTKYFISLPYYIYIYIYINIIKFYIVHSLYIDYIHCIFEHIYIYI